MPLTVALCAIMRDEARYIVEWIAYHRVIGFDSILIYDNHSTDALPAICRALAAAGVITYVPWPDPLDSLEHGPQVYAYQHAARHLDADWLCCLDADEFLTLETAATVQTLIADAGRDRMPIALNWRNFGSGGAIHAVPGLVMERFQRCGTPASVANINVKTLGPMSAVRAGASVHIHGWPLAGGQHYVNATGARVEVEGSTWLKPPRWRGAWINHYIVKSLEEFEEKQRRGDASMGSARPDKYGRTYEGYFLPYDQNECEDQTIQRFVASTKQEMARLEEIVENARMADVA